MRPYQIAVYAVMAGLLLWPAFRTYVVPATVKGGKAVAARAKKFFARKPKRKPKPTTRHPALPNNVLIAAAILTVAFVASDPIKSVAPPAPATATSVTYVYEKDDTNPPAQVASALNRLNREKKIIATMFEDDTKDGSGEVPDQYRVPLAAALEAGLPALVVTNGETVLTVVKAPTTEAQVLEATP